MKIHFIGCRASCEAVPKYMHTSFAIEVNNKIYFIDAGEGCSYTAYNMGIDLLKVKEIFISHPHMDHIGGLANLLWNIQKLSFEKKMLPVCQDVGLHISDKETYEGICKMLKSSCDDFKWSRSINFSKIKPGLIFSDDNISVYAVHNGHMSKVEADDGLSFSFKILAEGKSIIYSGDIKGLEDLDELLNAHCDCLFIESGHQTVEDICAYLNTKDVDTVIFMHHRKDVMKNIQTARLYAMQMANFKVCFAEDGKYTEI